MRTAHFTLAELPGTLLIWVSGIAIGAAFFTRGERALAVTLALIAGIAAAVVG